MLATAEKLGTSAVANRIRLLDVLRGVTILGMLGTNMWLFSTVLVEIEERGHPFGITGVIHQEVLQGAASRAKFDYLAEYLDSQTFYHPKTPSRATKRPRSSTSAAAGPG